MTINGQNQTTDANPSPVATMIPVAASSKVRSEVRCAVSPKASVIAAEPMSVPVTTAPTCTGEKPSPVRYWASSTLTKPSAKPRMPRPHTMRVTSGGADSGRMRRMDLRSVAPMPTDALDPSAIPETVRHAETD